MKKAIVFLVAVVAFITSVQTADAQIRKVGIDMGYQRNYNFYANLDPREITQKDVYVPEVSQKRLEEIRAYIKKKDYRNTLTMDNYIVTKVLVDDSDCLKIYFSYWEYNKEKAFEFFSGVYTSYYGNKNSPKKIYYGDAGASWNDINSFAQTSIRIKRNGVLQ